MRCVVLWLACVVATSTLWAQDAAPDITTYLSRVEKGEADAVRSELPALLTKYPNNPGVLYLQGVLTTDGTEAVRIYQSIVDNFPRSEWADDALYKVYQFYYSIGLYRTAEIKLHQLEAEYPQSKYLARGSQPDTQGLAEEKGSGGVGEADSTRAVPQDSIRTAVQSPSGGGTVRPTPPAVRGQYALQMGAYSQQVNAEKQKLFFEDLGYAVEVVNKVLGNRPLFVVLVGEYRTAEEARAKGAELREKFDMHPMVVTR